MAGRKPNIGDKARKEKVMFYVTDEMLSDLRALASIEEITMTEKIIKLIESEIEKNSTKLQAFRKVQNMAFTNE